MNNKIEQHFLQLDETTHDVIHSTWETTAIYNKLLWELLIKTVVDGELYEQFRWTSVLENARNTQCRIQNILDYKQDVCLAWQEWEFTKREINRKYFWLEEVQGDWR